MGESVLILKLITGEEVIGKIGTDPTNGGDNYYVLFSPLVLVPVRKPEGTMLVMSPFTYGGDVTKTGVKIHSRHVVCSMSPDEGLKNQYLAGLAGLTMQSSKITL